MGAKPVAKNWWSYLRLLYQVQGELQDPALRTFSILPLCSFAAEHITIDIKILHGLVTRIAARTGRPKPEKESLFIQNGRMHWEKYFRLQKAEGAPRDRDDASEDTLHFRTRRVMQTTLKTDGYAISITLGKPLPEGTVKRRSKKAATYRTSATTMDMSEKRVVGLDPGRVDLVSCAWYSPQIGAPPVFSHYSNREYQQKIGVRKAKEKRKRWTSSELTTALNQLPSAKIHSVSLLISHIRELYTILPAVVQLNCERRVRSLRFSQHCLSQRVMHDICNRILASDDPTDDRLVVVAFGAAMFSSCSRGHAPGPVK